MFGGDLVEGEFDALVSFGVVKEGSGYCLDATFPYLSRSGEFFRSVWLLIFHASIYWCIPLVRLMLGSGGRYMLKFLEGKVGVFV